jgi:hypothetical protein
LQTHLTKREIAAKYRLHFFVAFIFVCAVLFVSLGWYYKDLTREEDLLNQKIFLDPRSKVLTLTDDEGENGVGYLLVVILVHVWKMRVIFGITANGEHHSRPSKNWREKNTL